MDCIAQLRIPGSDREKPWEKPWVTQMAIEKWEKPTKWRFPLAIFDYDSGYHKLIFGKLSLSRFALAQCLDHLDSSCPHCQFRIVPNPILSPLAKVAGPLDTPYLSCIHSLSILLVTRHPSSIFRTHPMPT